MNSAGTSETNERLRRLAAAFIAFLTQNVAVFAALFFDQKVPVLARVPRTTRDSNSADRFNRK